ncbi:hypothetical protein HAX54_001730 [Datura stramonium]|uniref:Uncharacterized protein n=1 Tax=Datura stramonium TaxID=4076 RepID=A0ABS8RVZ8_DATST|nr:hypothetical protein [Datura stramonium]
MWNFLTPYVLRLFGRHGPSPVKNEMKKDSTNEEVDERGWTDIQGKSASKNGKAVQIQGHLAIANGFDLLWDMARGDAMQPSSSSSEQGGKEDWTHKNDPAHSLLISLHGL